MWEMRGPAQFDDGSIAKMKSAGTMNLARGTGLYFGYVLYIFGDGSTKFRKIEGLISKPMFRPRQPLDSLAMLPPTDPWSQAAPDRAGRSVRPLSARDEPTG